MNCQPFDLNVMEYTWRTGDISSSIPTGLWGVLLFSEAIHTHKFTRQSSADDCQLKHLLDYFNCV